MTDTIYEQLAATWPRYHQPSTPQEGTMSLADLATRFKDGAEKIDTEIHTWLSEHVPHLVDLAANVEESPLVQAALAAVLPPEVEQEIASLVNRLHQSYNTGEDQPAGPQPEQVPAQPAA